MNTDLRKKYYLEKGFFKLVNDLVFRKDYEKC